MLAGPLAELKARLDVSLRAAAWGAVAALADRSYDLQIVRMIGIRRLLPIAILGGIAAGLPSSQKIKQDLL